MRTLSFILVCTFICILFGIPIGVLMARHGRMRATVTPMLDIMQPMPSFVYLIPVVMLFGVGKVPGAIAVIAYAIPPVIRLTDLGIRLVDGEVLEASEGSTKECGAIRQCTVQLQPIWPRPSAGHHRSNFPAAYRQGFASGLAA